MSYPYFNNIYKKHKPFNSFHSIQYYSYLFKTVFLLKESVRYHFLNEILDIRINKSLIQTQLSFKFTLPYFINKKRKKLFKKRKKNKRKKFENLTKRLAFRSQRISSIKKLVKFKQKKKQHFIYALYSFNKEILKSMYNTRSISYIEKILLTFNYTKRDIQRLHPGETIKTGGLRRAFFFDNIPTLYRELTSGSTVAAFVTNYLNFFINKDFKYKNVVKFNVKKVSFFLKSCIQNILISGFRLRIKGPFKASMQSKVIWSSEGRMGKSWLNSDLAYEHVQICTRYGIFGLKLWTSLNPFSNYYRDNIKLLTKSKQL